MSEDPQLESPVRQAPAYEFFRTHAISGRTSSRIVLELIDSMKANGWIGLPIIVVEYGGETYVLDGHHRLAAARYAKIEVPYRVVGIDELSKFGYSSIDQVVQAYAEAGVNRLRLS